MWKRVAVTVALTTISLQAQTPPELAFEVASVKRNVSGETRTYFRTPPTGLVTITNTTLRILIGRAFQIDGVMERFQLVAATDTPLIRGNSNLEDVEAPRFDVQGKAPDNAPPGQQYAMLRTLLAQRFKLRAHKELRPVPVYALRVAREGRLGPQLQISTADCAVFQTERSKNPATAEPRNADGQPLCISFAPSPAGMNVFRSAGPISQLVSRLQVGLDRPLVDETGLSGTFAWNLSFEGRVNSFDAVASTPVFTAVQEQLGLRIEARTAPFEVLVIDSVEMPSEN